MRVFFDPKPYRTFSLQINISVGWRHENPKSRGVLMESISNLKDSISGVLPRWFEIEHFVDAEFSGIRIFGTLEELNLPGILKIADASIPSGLVELGGGIESVAISGAFKADDVKVLEGFKPVHRPGRAKIEFKPRGFLSTRELSRLEKIFVVFTVARRGGEIFLEVSRGGSRIHYGKNIPDLQIDSIEYELRRFELYVLKKHESTSESVKFLSLLNVYSKETLTFHDVLERLRSLRIAEITETLSKLREIVRRIRR